MNFKMLVLQKVMSVLISKLGTELVGEALSGAFDKIEEKVKSTPNKYDDAVVLPLLKLARDSLCPDEVKA